MKIELFWEDQITLSHSRMKLWRRCQMAHWYRYYARLRKIKPPTALFVGTGIHSILEAHALRGHWQEEWEAFKTDFNKLFIEERQELGDLPAMVKTIMEGYFIRYENDGLTYPKRHRGKNTEIPVTVDLSNHVRFVGFIDRFPVDRDGRNWVMDHKSCKNVPDEDSRFADLQLLLYVWLLPQLGYPQPDGVIWDYIRKKPPTIPEVLVKGGISKNKSIDTTYAVYMQTVYEKLGVDALPQYEEFAQTLKGREDRFYRRIYLPSPNKSMVESVVRDVIATGKEIYERGATSMVRNMGRDCKSCSYYSLCSAEVRGLDSEFIRKTEYTVKEKDNGIETQSGSGSPGDEDSEE